MDKNKNKNKTWSDRVGGYKLISSIIVWSHIQHYVACDISSTSTIQYGPLNFHVARPRVWDTWPLVIQHYSLATRQFRNELRVMWC